MDGKSSLSAGAIAIIALLIHVAIPGGKESGGSGERRADTSETGKKKTADAGSDKPDSKLEGPWLATRYFFGYPGPDEESAHKDTKIDLDRKSVFERKRVDLG